ncbi:MAG: Gfo/Idh/MocA family oxidoreductase [Bacteroidota bacterium]
MVKIGVIGAGHLGKIHIRLLKEIEGFDLVGFYDPDANTSKKVSEEFGIKNFLTSKELLDACDAVDIVTPTLFHHDYAAAALKKSKHIFIEKPITSTIKEAKHLVSLSHEANVKVQIGHVERFNPAFLAAKPFFNQPMFIETHRLAQFNPRGTDVSVVLDLMIHDIDIILSMVNSPIKRVSASGVAVVSDTPDICNARIEFHNGCVANLTASRISMKNMRKTRVFQKDAYISVDFLDKELSIVRLKQVVGTPDPLSVTIDLGEKGTKEIYFDAPKPQPNNAIKEELTSFLNSIINNNETAVTINDGYRALDVASKIIEKMKLTSERMM